MKVSIVIPAHNEEKRIQKTLEQYAHYFEHYKQTEALVVELLVVLNGCSDNTLAIVQDAQTRWGSIVAVNLEQAGKGLAIAAGFKDALLRDNDLIGFVDADMATQPQYFYELIKNIGADDGIVASRYMQGAHVFPPRPWIKYWGGRLIYDNMVKALFGLNYHDYQCGAKLFKRPVIESIVSQLTIKQWAFDVELLYLGKKNGFKVTELPTVWHDQAGSKLNIMGSGMRMLGSVVKLRLRYSPLYSLMTRTKDTQKK